MEFHYKCMFKSRTQVKLSNKLIGRHPIQFISEHDVPRDWREFSLDRVKKVFRISPFSVMVKLIDGTRMIIKILILFTPRRLISSRARLPEGPAGIITPSIARYPFTPEWRVANVD